MIHPNIPAEIPGIEIESDLMASRVQVCSNKPDMADRASAARSSAGLNDDTVPDTETRGVDIAPYTSKVLNDDADPGVAPGV